MTPSMETWAPTIIFRTGHSPAAGWLWRAIRRIHQEWDCGRRRIVYYEAPMQHEMMIVVCGATGQQGSHVVESLLARGRFKVKAFSREPQSPKGRRLVESGVLVEQGDL